MILQSKVPHINIWTCSGGPWSHLYRTMFFATATLGFSNDAFVKIPKMVGRFFATRLQWNSADGSVESGCPEIKRKH